MAAVIIIGIIVWYIITEVYRQRQYKAEITAKREYYQKYGKRRPSSHKY